MTMTAAIKGVFAVIAALLFALAGLTVLIGAHITPGFAPNTGQTFLLDAIGGALVAFIAAQLGLAIGSRGDGLRSRIRTTMGAPNWGDRLLLLDVAVFLIIGLWFVLLWVWPGLVAVAEGADPLKEAPGYVESQGKLFTGVVLASLAALAPSANQ